MPSGNLFQIECLVVLPVTSGWQRFPLVGLTDGPVYMQDARASQYGTF